MGWLGRGDPAVWALVQLGEGCLGLRWRHPAQQHPTALQPLSTGQKRALPSHCSPCTKAEARDCAVCGCHLAPRGAGGTSSRAVVGGKEAGQRRSPRAHLPCQACVGGLLPCRCKNWVKQAEPGACMSALAGATVGGEHSAWGFLCSPRALAPARSPTLPSPHTCSVCIGAASTHSLLLVGVLWASQTPSLLSPVEERCPRGVPV